MDTLLMLALLQKIDSASQVPCIKAAQEIIQSNSAIELLTRLAICRSIWTSKKPGRQCDLAEHELIAISSGSGRACRDLPQAR